MVDRRDAVVAGDPRRYSHGRFTCRDLGQASAVFRLSPAMTRARTFHDFDLLHYRHGDNATRPRY
jgi:hypothetical protein